jgi:hypothetical protein
LSVTNASDGANVVTVYTEAQQQQAYRLLSIKILTFLQEEVNMLKEMVQVYLC